MKSSSPHSCCGSSQHSFFRRPSVILSLALLVPLLLAALISCATSPLGRRQLKLMPDSQMTELGIQSFRQIKKETPIEKNSEINTYVRCVSLALLDALEGSNPPSWEIVVFDEKAVNAFALPGKRIGVYKGLLTVAETQHQLAAVIGHEIGHVIASHGNERVSQTLATQGGLAVASIALQNKNSNTRNLVLAGLGLGAQVGLLLPFGRTQESEADIIGLDLMAKAGFEPSSSVTLWQNMGRASGGGGPPEFLSTHPAHSTRIRDLQKNMDQATAKYEQAKASGKNPNCTPPSMPRP